MLIENLTKDQKQNLLNALHNKTMETLQQYASGLITLSELIDDVGSTSQVIAFRIEDTSGLLCPNTGLRLP
jgi:hypothetical protein